MNVYSYVPNGKKSVGVEESSLIEMAFFAVYSFIPHFKYLKFINFILLSLPGILPTNVTLYVPTVTKINLLLAI